MDLNISQSDVVDTDEWVRIAGCERVQKATRATATRLLLLLGPDIDWPPDRFEDLQVVVENVRDFAPAAW